MKRFIMALLYVVAFLSSAFAGIPRGGASIPLSGSASPTTIYATWNTPSATATSMACGTTFGTYNINAVYNSKITTTTHWIVVSGLIPSTIYYCQTGDGGTFSVTTMASPSSTPLVSATLGIPFNPVNGQNNGDFYANCKSTDNITHVATDDTSNGWGGVALSANMSVNYFANESPLTGANGNGLSNFGSFASCPISAGGKNYSPKITGMFCDLGNIYINYSLLYAGNCAGFSGPAGSFNYGNILRSANHATSWSYPGALQSYNANGAVPSPTTYTMYSDINVGSSCTFVSYAPDNGTNLPTYRIDNNDAYVYLICNQFQNYNVQASDEFFLIRIARQALADTSISSIDLSTLEYFIGGSTGNGQNGINDAAWSTSSASIAPLYTNSAQLGVPTMQYMQSVGRYVTMDCWNKGTAGHGDTQCVIWESPQPWGPLTSISGPTEFTPQGYYYPTALQDAAAAATANGTAMRFVASGDFTNGSYYQLWEWDIVLNTH
jgi:hypothetical protein